MEKLLTQENQVVTIVIIGVLFLLLMSVGLLLFFFLSRKKIVEKELDKKSLEVSHQKELLKSIIVTQEKERKRIAQDLHDDISSKLNVISLNANLLKDGELSPDEYLIINEGILEATEKTLDSARKIAHNLLPPILAEFGLKDAIEELADSYNNSRKINVTYSLFYPKNYLQTENELHVFRIVQELINNSVRHGNAKESNIYIEIKDNIFFFNYTDNGIGFNMKDANCKKGLGMKNIESRVALLNGKFSIESSLNNGFKILVII
ncbi:sensor histidine kinase [Polaribacter sp.]|uniref:sensor histidine kinase n=1 Tax=Polaribacter sp. TaxID=1920175 RepID=UPI003EFA2580